MFDLGLDMDSDCPSGLASLGISVAKAEDIISRCHGSASNISEIELLLDSLIAERGGHRRSGDPTIRGYGVRTWQQQSHHGDPEGNSYQKHCIGPLLGRAENL